LRFPGHPELAANPPCIRTGWDVNGVTLAQTLALLPPLTVVLAAQGVALIVLITALVVTLVWELCFAFIRGRNLGWHGITTALIFIVLAPETVPIWQVAVALSFGTVLGELIFGGRGFGFLNAAAVSLAFLVFSFPQTELSVLTPVVAYACIPGAALLLLSGVISWRIIFATLVTILIIKGLRDFSLPPASIAPAFVFILIFMICDPVAASVTNGGRWLYGTLTGFLIVLFNAGFGLDFSTESLIFATLLGSIFAPLLDDIIVRLNIRKRRRRNG
jgi:Na+-transporting NADH:ubiquinone oxidoreductase subunit B